LRLFLDSGLGTVTRSCRGNPADRAESAGEGRLLRYDKGYSSPVLPARPNGSRRARPRRPRRELEPAGERELVLDLQDDCSPARSASSARVRHSASSRRRLAAAS